ncbi:hypothetical protein Tco_0088721 [Tanacetum coccineum]
MFALERVKSLQRTSRSPEGSCSCESLRLRIEEERLAYEQRMICYSAYLAYQAPEAGARVAHWRTLVAVFLELWFQCALPRDSTQPGMASDSQLSGTGVRDLTHALKCTYNIMKCKPLYFKGTEGVVELTQWFERMKTVFRISNNCSVENQVKFSTCTLLASALTWWNSPV